MKKKQYYLRGGLSQPKCLRDRPHRKRAVLEAIVLGLWAGPVETTWTNGENIRRRKFLADAPPAPALLLKPPELNPSGQRRFLSSLQQSSSIAIGDQQSMAATAAAPLDEGKAKKVLRQVRDPALLPQLHNIFFPFSRAILRKSTYLIWLPQVEFYLSDSNLPRDKFLRETVEQSDDGCSAPRPLAPSPCCLVLWAS